MTYTFLKVALPSVRWRTMEELLHHNDQDSIFSRLVLVDNISPILDKEASELSEALSLARASQSEEQIPFIEKALKELEVSIPAPDPLFFLLSSQS
jgi:hypothetical protein